MTKDELIALAKQKAAEHNLDPALVCAICEQESTWRPWAIRYEPAFMRKYVAPLFMRQAIDATEAYGRCFSWGIMQIMGEVAREHGFSGQFLAELCDPPVNLDVGCCVFAADLYRARGDVSKALLAWNGGSNPAYPSEALARMGTYTPGAQPED